MKKILLLVLILLNIKFHSEGQKIDTVWYNQQNQEVKDFSKRDHYKTTKYNNDTKLFEVIGHRMNGQITLIGSFLSLNPLIKNGAFVYYDKNGTITNKTIYDHDIITEIYQYESGNQTNHIINKDNPPKEPVNDKSAKYMSIGAPLELNNNPVEYSEGEAALKSFIEAHLVYPKDALTNKIQGTVFIQIMIDEKGKAYDFSIQRASDPLLNNEAIRLAKLIPNKWIAARNAQKQPVKSSITIPIKFSL